MSESGMQVQRRYLMEVKPFTRHDDVYALIVEIVPLDRAVWLRVWERFDTKLRAPMFHSEDREVASQHVAHLAMGWGLADLASALYSEDLRGSIERNAAHQLFLAIATDTKTPHGFAKPWAHEWLPEWATWWDETMSRFRASEASGS